MTAAEPAQPPEDELEWEIIELVEEHGSEGCLARAS
jgi:hypothetical protein